MESDHQGRRVHLQTQPSMHPCEECGRPGPNKEWRILRLGASGVLCTRCLSQWIEEVNAQLGAKASKPTSTYEPRPGDIYLHQLRPGQWNLHRYIAGVWEYQTMLTEAEVETFVRHLQLIGETNDVPLGRRRYYRPFQA